MKMKSEIDHLADLEPKLLKRPPSKFQMILSPGSVTARERLPHLTGAYHNQNSPGISTPGSDERHMAEPKSSAMMSPSTSSGRVRSHQLQGSPQPSPLPAMMHVGNNLNSKSRFTFSNSDIHGAPGQNRPIVSGYGVGHNQFQYKQKHTGSDLKTGAAAVGVGSNVALSIDEINASRGISKNDVVQPRLRVINNAHELPVPTVHSESQPMRLYNQPPHRYKAPVDSRHQSKSVPAESEHNNGASYPTVQRNETGINSPSTARNTTPAGGGSGGNGVPKFVGSSFVNMVNAPHRGPPLALPKNPTIPKPYPVPTPAAFAHIPTMLHNRSPDGRILGGGGDRGIYAPVPARLPGSPPVPTYSQHQQQQQQLFSHQRMVVPAVGVSVVDECHVPYLPPDEPVGPDNPVKELNDTWTACWDNEAGAIYYYNKISGEATWLPPDSLS